MEDRLRNIIRVLQEGSFSKVPHHRCSNSKW